MQSAVKEEGHPEQTERLEVCCYSILAVHHNADP